MGGWQEGRGGVGGREGVRGGVVEEGEDGTEAVGGD